jgi:hypothetical protein
MVYELDYLRKFTHLKHRIIEGHYCEEYIAPEQFTSRGEGELSIGTFTQKRAGRRLPHAK